MAKYTITIEDLGTINRVYYTLDGEDTEISPYTQEGNTITCEVDLPAGASLPQVDYVSSEVEEPALSLDTIGAVDIKSVTDENGNMLNYTVNENGTINVGDTVAAGTAISINYDLERIKIGALDFENGDKTKPTKYGMRIRNSQGEDVLTTDDNGDITMTGTIHAYAGDFTGTVNAQAGEFSGNVRVGADDKYVALTTELENGPAIASSDYMNDRNTGWAIIGNGDAYFHNITARGCIRTAVFEYEEINAVGGAFLFRPSSTIRGALLDDDDIIITVEKDNGFNNGDWVKIAGAGSTAASLFGGIYQIEKVYDIYYGDESNETSESSEVLVPCTYRLLGAAADFSPYISEQDSERVSALEGGAFISLCGEPDESSEFYDNYGIGINSGQGQLFMPERAISLFETSVDDSGSSPEVSMAYTGILGTLPKLEFFQTGVDESSQPTYSVDTDIYRNMEKTQGIYTNNMYIGDEDQYVAFYTDQISEKIKWDSLTGGSSSTQGYTTYDLSYIPSSIIGVSAGERYSVEPVYEEQHVYYPLASYVLNHVPAIDSISFSGVRDEIAYTLNGKEIIFSSGQATSDHFDIYYTAIDYNYALDKNIIVFSAPIYPLENNSILTRLSLAYNYHDYPKKLDIFTNSINIGLAGEKTLYLIGDQDGVALYRGNEKVSSTKDILTNNIFLSDYGIEIRNGQQSLSSFTSNGIILGNNSSTYNYITPDSYKIYNKDKTLYEFVYDVLDEYHLTIDKSELKTTPDSSNVSFNNSDFATLIKVSFLSNLDDLDFNEYYDYDNMLPKIEPTLINITNVPQTIEGKNCKLLFQPSAGNVGVLVSSIGTTSPFRSILKESAITPSPSSSITISSFTENLNLYFKVLGNILNFNFTKGHTKNVTFLIDDTTYSATLFYDGMETFTFTCNYNLTFEDIIFFGYFKTGISSNIDAFIPDEYIVYYSYSNQYYPSLRIGQYADEERNYSLVVGKGSYEGGRETAFGVDWDGHLYIYDDIIFPNHNDIKFYAYGDATGSAVGLGTYNPGSAQGRYGTLQYRFGALDLYELQTKVDGEMALVSYPWDDSAQETDWDNPTTEWSVNMNSLQTTTPPISVTATSGKLNSVVARRFGNIINISMNVENISSTPSGQNIFTGQIDSSDFYPAVNTTGSSYNGARIAGAFLNVNGVITLRNTMTTACGTGTGFTFSFTYIVE